MGFYTNKIIFLDIETTGFSRQWNEIIEIAAVLVDNSTKSILDTFHTYIKPRARITSQITELTRITNEMVAGAPSEERALMDFSEWVALTGAQTIVGHNCKSFDLSFIAERCKRYGIAWSIDGFTICDTLALARSLNKDGSITVANCKQPTLAQYFNIDYEAHSAIEDVKALIKIYYKLNALTEDVGF